MAMQWLEGELIKTGDKQDALFAKQIAIVREFRGDIPLPTASVEAPKAEVARFSPEQRFSLQEKGYRFYELTGQSIASLREQGKPFWSTWHKDYPEFAALTSRHSEVAIDPKKLFIPRSNNKTLEQQLEAVAKYSDSLGIQGVEAILGEVPDYTELAFAHFDKTGERLFGEKYDYNYTRTQTRFGSDVAFVGSFRAGVGLNVNRWGAAYRSGDLRAAPLVVPVSGTK
jgi:hypothetical protein